MNDVSLTFQNDNATSPVSATDPFQRRFQETSMIDPTEAAGWISAGKSGLDLLRAAWTLMPKGAEKDRIARKLEEAELALELSNAKLAKELGFRLCQCRFPPLPMLWDNGRGAFICQNVACGRVDVVEKPQGARRARQRARA
jgi:hypothetical protein